MRIVKILNIKNSDFIPESEITRYFELLPESHNDSTYEDIELIESKGRPLISMSSKDYIGEIIREKAYLFLRKEVPYSVNVEVDSVVDKRNIIVIKARILTTADRYKKMIIGVDGKKIKEIGYNARKELELMSSRKIFLELLVEIDKHWAERDIER